MGTHFILKNQIAPFIVFLLGFLASYGQTYLERELFSHRLGLNYGQGTQQSFPFFSSSYTYEVTFVKINYNFNFAKLNKMRIGLTIEPGIYFSSEGELPKIQATEGKVKTEDKGEPLQNKASGILHREMNEYVLNLGVQMSYALEKNLDWYILGSVGPMIIDTETQRQKKGFAFSDIFATGFLYRINRVILDIRYGVRHVSNAGFGRPNKGYNSTNLEMGFSIPLRKSSKKYTS